MKISQEKLRLITLGVVVWLVFSLFLFRLAQVQIVSGADYLAKQQQGSSRTQVIKAARGEIVDRQGRPFSYNEACYNLVFDRALAPEGSENETILKLIDVLRSANEQWIDNLPLIITEEGVAFSEDSDAVARLRKHLGTNSYTEAEDVFYWLRQRYHLTAEPEDPKVTWFTALTPESKSWLEGLTEAQARDIAGVRYEMERKGYSLAVRYTFAENISLETAVLIRQMSNAIPGVEVAETARRGYIDGDLAPHIIGRIGAIFADELEGYLSQNKGYTRDDLVGKEGIERAFESTLRGVDGVRRIDLDASYHVVDITEEQAAVPGNTLVLTIDKDIQRTARDALVKEIKYLNENAPEGQGKEANAGAVVAIDVKNSEVLAAVTYPSYNLETYSEDYAKNASDELYPFLNRAFSGIYAPGSCFKPVVGTAGMAEGIITPGTTVNCQRVYTFLPTYQPTCLGYHGPFTLADSLRASCNIFFYDTGRQLGIARINQYAKGLGLGVPTGIELTEAKGTQCDPNTVYPGDVLQAAIGQLDNGYTPVQLANYCATLARRGVRMKLSLVKSISSYYNWEETISTHTPEVADTLGADPSIFDPVIDGMVQASHDVRGTAYRYLGDYPVMVASKTGTPQTNEFPNSTFICFAPADDPQIAIAVVIEKGWHGYTGAPVARAVLDSFFFPDKAENIADETKPQTAESAPESSEVTGEQGNAGIQAP
ncbi:peptidoglycan D,D-transpeptidase FtsI family protein [Oscillospiraceae bacterium LTW-04]|nr:penicillin-binding transpeptidase domain-containing protein [Oscillospiraceae bacterium MB24-C1]